MKDTCTELKKVSKELPGACSLLREPQESARKRDCVRGKRVIIWPASKVLGT